jgi:ABC-type uncharacterized transport system substrate-binding protein
MASRLARNNPSVCAASASSPTKGVTILKATMKSLHSSRCSMRAGGGSAAICKSIIAGVRAMATLAPDVLLAPGGTVTGALQRATHEIPIVFVETTDPVDRGLVASLSKPGGNITGFTQFDFAISGKWLELLKEVVPGITRVAVIRDPAQFSGVAELAVIQAVASSHSVEISVIDARDLSGIETAIAQFALGP